jgi:tetratricopeptide (TPR) repeat protein
VIFEPDGAATPDTIVPGASTPGPYVPIEPAPDEAQPQVPGEGEPGTDAALPGTEGKVPIEVEPQERIPVNNALLADAARMFQEGRYEESRALLVQAVLSEPENGFSELAYALGHFAVGEYDPAAEAVRRGAALVPDVIDLPIDVVRQYGKPKDFETHLQALQLYAAAHPDDQNAWFLLGYVMYSSGKPEEAQRAFEKAAKLNPSDTYAAVFRDAAGRVKVKPVE